MYSPWSWYIKRAGSTLHWTKRLNACPVHVVPARIMQHLEWGRTNILESLSYSYLSFALSNPPYSFFVNLLSFSLLSPSPRTPSPPRLRSYCISPQLLTFKEVLQCLISRLQTLTSPRVALRRYETKILSFMSTQPHSRPSSTNMFFKIPQFFTNHVFFLISIPLDSQVCFIFSILYCYHPLSR